MRLQLKAKGDALVAQTVECLPAMQETWVWSLGQEDPLEKEMATHSSYKKKPKGVYQDLYTSVGCKL